MLDVKCLEHLEEVKKFAESIGLADQLQKQLDFLDKYGHDPNDTSPQRRLENRCVLKKDFAPHSFDFAIYRPDAENPGQERLWLNGGLIYQGPDSPANGGAPSFTVSLAEGVGWFLHT